MDHHRHDADLAQLFASDRGTQTVLIGHLAWHAYRAKITLVSTTWRQVCAHLADALDGLYVAHSFVHDLHARLSHRFANVWQTFLTQGSTTVRRWSPACFVQTWLTMRQVVMGTCLTGLITAAGGTGTRGRRSENIFVTVQGPACTASANGVCHV